MTLDVVVIFPIESLGTSFLPFLLFHFICDDYLCRVILKYDFSLRLIIEPLLHKKLLVAFTV